MRKSKISPNTRNNRAQFIDFDDQDILDQDSGDEKPAEPDDFHYENSRIGQKRKRSPIPSLQDTNALFQSTEMRSKVEDDDTFILDDGSALVTKPSTRVPGTFGHGKRQKSESMPAYHKRVTHELDSDDELIMQMREKGFSDRQIADKLAKDGRVRYDQKSISTRIMRIRLAQAENVEILLREGYKEWEFEDVSHRLNNSFQRSCH